MAQAAEREQTQPTVAAALRYMIHTGDKPVTRISEAGVRPTERDARVKKYDVTIRDGRLAAADFTLDREGFVLARNETKVTDFYDDEEVRRVYYPELEALVKAHSGAARVVVFDHTIRANNETIRTAQKVREPVRLVHNDYTEKSGPQRVRELLPPDEAETLLERRFAVVQVWRSAKGPVLQSPLAICDARSIAAKDLIATDLVYQGRTGEVYQIAFNPDHRWFYFPNMAADEALVFKCYDSMTDGRARFSAHTAFDDPNTPPGAPERESIEARTFAFF